MSHRTSWKPQEKGMMSTTVNLPSVMIPRFNRPVGERNHSQRLLLVDFATAPEGVLMAWCLRRQQRGTCTQHNQNTLPQLTVRLSISPVC
jgi:hypothetical protein